MFPQHADISSVLQYQKKTKKNKPKTEQFDSCTVPDTGTLAWPGSTDAQGGPSVDRAIDQPCHPEACEAEYSTEPTDSNTHRLQRSTPFGHYI